MSDVSSVLLAVLLPVVCMWAGATALVTLVMLRVTAARGGRGGGGAAPRLPAEMWGAIAASGAAAGGVLGLSTVAPTLPLAAAATGGGSALARLLTVAAAGMLVGALLTAGLVLLAVWLWTDGG